MDKCLYHRNHFLTSFCQCSTCFLPACQVCVRIHKNQHTMNETIPDFKKLTEVVKEVQNQYKKQQQRLKLIKRKIQLAPQKIIKSEKQLKRQFKQKREILIQSFENILICLQKQLISSIQNQSVNYLRKIQHLDSKLQSIIEDKIYKQQQIGQKQSQKKIQLVVDYFSLGLKQLFENQFKQLEREMDFCENYTIRFSFQQIDNLLIYMKSKETVVMAELINKNIL